MCKEPVMWGASWHFLVMLRKRPAPALRSKVTEVHSWHGHYCANSLAGPSLCIEPRGSACARPLYLYEQRAGVESQKGPCRCMSPYRALFEEALSGPTKTWCRPDRLAASPRQIYDPPSPGHDKTTSDGTSTPFPRQNTTRYSQAGSSACCSTSSSYAKSSSLRL